MAGKKTGLGKGLDSLIPMNVMEEIDDKKIKDISQSGETIVKLSQIEPNANQPRKNFNEDALQELADSIKQFGIIQPLVVQKKGRRYEIIAGERRWRAARIAGIKEVPVIIKDYNDQQVMEIALIENIQREDLNPIEEAQAYKRLNENGKNELPKAKQKTLIGVFIEQFESPIVYILLIAMVLSFIVKEKMV